jgi:acyl-CoA synthetase (AMP-forming)/AMP-acid ligase II
MLALIESVARRQANKAALDDGTLALTYGELHARAGELLSALDRLVPRSSDVLVRVAPSSAFILLQIALLAGGHRVIQVPTSARADLLAKVASATGTSVAVVDQTDNVDISSIRLVFRISDRGALSSDQRVDGHIPATESKSRGPGRVVMCTSGTTGTPKLVELSQSAFAYSATSLRDVLDLTSGDRLFHHLSIAQGPGYFLWAGLSAGASNLIVKHCHSKDLPDALLDIRPTALFTVSPGLWTLIDRGVSSVDIPELRTLYYSSGPVALKLKRILVDSFGSCLIQDYGMTEVPEPLTVLSRADHLRGQFDQEILSSVGRPLHPERIRLRIDNAERDAVREIEAQSPAMFTAYWKNTDLTRESIVDGWFRSRDLGSFDKRGYLHLAGRVDRVARSGGLDIDLAEVEESIQLIEQVVRAQVSARPDERFGERVEAIVHIRVGAALDEVQLRAKLKSMLDPRAIPREIHIIETTQPEPTRS